jgi:4-amino-4-deoxy-L-arabinose transferase-like glycosyltransferase
VTVSRRWWILLAVLFLLPRLALLFAELGRPLRGDELSYAQIAHNVATGHGFSGGEGAEIRAPTAVRGPVYVLIVAAFERIFGPTRTPVFLFQVLLDALALVLVVRIARAWFASGRTAWLAGALYATYPPIVIAVTSLLTETLTHVTLLAWVAFFFRYLDRRRWQDLVVASVALGLCALGKPALVLFAPVTCLAAWSRLGARGFVRVLSTVTLLIALTLSPWIVRNAVVFHAFIPGVSLGGMGLLFGSGAFNGRTVGALQDANVPDSIRAHVATMDEMEANRWAARETRRVVAADPVGYAKLSAAKVARLWFNLGFHDPPSRMSLGLALFNFALLVLAVMGSSASRDPSSRRLLLFGAVYWTLVHVPFVANVRYAVPFYALVFPFAAAGVVRLLGSGALVRRGS